MLKSLSTITFWADELGEATRWYTELLGFPPYYSSEAAGKGAGYVEFRVGPQHHELGLAERRFAPRPLQPVTGGAVCYWEVESVDATSARLLELGAKVLEPRTDRGGGYVTASFVDPFGNVLGVLTRPAR